MQTECADWIHCSASTYWQSKVCPSEGASEDTHCLHRHRELLAILQLHFPEPHELPIAFSRKPIASPDLFGLETNPWLIPFLGEKRIWKWLFVLKKDMTFFFLLCQLGWSLIKIFFLFNIPKALHMLTACKLSPPARNLPSELQTKVYNHPLHRLSQRHREGITVPRSPLTVPPPWLTMLLSDGPNLALSPSLSLSLSLSFSLCLDDLLHLIVRSTSNSSQKCLLS